MESEISLMEFLHEIESITDVNGCYIINAEINKVIESTVPFKIPDDILWELGVLKTTFKQFANGIHQGELNDLIIEGEKGYIFLHSLPPYLILLTMGTQEINYSYYKLAMIDIMKRIKKRVEDLGEELLTIPPKEFGIVGVTPEAIPKPFEPKILMRTDISEKVSETSTITSPVKETPIKPVPVKITATETPSSTKPIEKQPIRMPIEEETPIERVVQLKPIEESPAKAEVPIALEVDFVALINSISSKSGKDKHIILEEIFYKLKLQLNSLTHIKLSNLLELLKDAILENIGTSLALFDISKAVRDLEKEDKMLSTEEMTRFRDRIDNWDSRIVQK